MKIATVIQDVIGLYDEMEYGESASISILVRDAGYDIDHDDLFEVLGALSEYAKSKDEVLDYSEYDNMVVGLAYNLWFVKRQKGESEEAGCHMMK